MKPFFRFLYVPILLGGLATAVSARAGACPGGGSLTITAAADSLSLSPVAATTFNFGEHVVLTAAASGFSIASYSWTIDGPTIKDYSESLGTQSAPSAPSPWSTTPLGSTDLSSPSPSFYWVPTAAQFEPNNGPFTRNVTLVVQETGGGSCSVTTPYTVERNEISGSGRKAEDFYTSNHRAATETNPFDGGVVDEHIYWHMNVDGDQTAFPAWMGFLAWHGAFVRRFDQWREEFGYNKVAPWYPGRPLPSGPQFDVQPALRKVYVADANRIPTYFTITGSSLADAGGQLKLSDYTTLSAFSDSFEGHFHGQVHCNIGASGGNFFETNGPSYGSMCLASSPKDPMFWRWHGFIDVLYRNYCALRPGNCSSPSPADPGADPWMADNPTDVTDNGTTPSPGTHWISPDVWNRRTQVTTDACVQPPDAYGDKVTTGGVARDCGTSADHENPVSGVMNYLYGTLRNTRPGSAGVVYAEVGVYYALASSGLTYPTDFTMIPESRQFIALQLDAGTTTSIGPIPWTPPPVPPANDHYCLYLRVLSVQATPPVEGMGVNTDVANNNNLAWRNIKVVPPGDTSPPSFFIVRNISDRAERLGLRFEVPPDLVRASIRVTLDETLTRALRHGDARLEGLKADGKGGFVITSPRAAILGLQMSGREQGHVKVEVGATRRSAGGDITITQVSAKGVDGGVTLRIAAKRREY